MLRVPKTKLGTADEEPCTTALHSPVLCVTTAASFHVVFTGSNCMTVSFKEFLSLIDGTRDALGPESFIWH